MSAERYEHFWQAIDVIEAREMLLAMQVGDFPHLKQAARQKAHKSLWKIAYPKLEEIAEEAVSPAKIMEELTRKLGRG